MGDSADNIKWVSGIGPKQASDLIKKYKTLDAIYEHIGEISWTLQQKLLEGKEDAYWSKNLIQLHTIPTIDEIDLSQFTLSFDFDCAKSVLVDRYGFVSFEKLLDEIKKKMVMPVQMWLF